MRTVISTAALAAGYPAIAAFAHEAGSKVSKTAAKSASRVVHAVSPYACSTQQVEKSIVRDLMEEALRALTGEAHSPDAWHRLLREDDQILIKCNQSGRERIGTTPTLIDELLRSLVSAGFDLGKISVLEARPIGLVQKTVSPDLRWQEKVVQFGQSGSDTFVAALDRATAIINVPFLKTHQMAVMTGCLKNLSHGLIRHPSRFHSNGCDPAIGEIVASEAIRSKLRVNVVNALRVVFDKGPEAGLRQIHPAGGLLLSTDPVAADAIGFGILNNVRSLHQMDPIIGGAGLPPQIATASRLGVGQHDVSKIELLDLAI
jgi:hypothetical protein